MEYGIIERMSALASSSRALEEKLKEAAGLLLECFSFDRCDVYLWDDKNNRFTLKASSPAPETGTIGAPRVYGAKEGLAGAVKDTGTIVGAHAGERESAALKGAADKGLIGFKSVYACPLKYDARFLGVVYLKSGKRAALTAEKKKLLNIAALQAAFAVIFDELLRDDKQAHEALGVFQARLANAEKLMALGDMAATLAHEIRNPLLSVGGFASRLRRHISGDPEALHCLERMLSEIKKIEHVIEGPIRYLKGGALELKPDNMNEILDEALSVFSEEIKAHAIKVVKDFHKGRLPVVADREQLKIAFDNLIANAIQSMENGGTLRLTTAGKEGWVIAEVADSGGGIDPRYIGNIFNPFFTTKKDGTGLGLSITNSIVVKHRGIIDVINNPGAGATFAVRLPAPPPDKEVH